MRKLFEARMISARRSGYEQIPLADSDRIQILIAEARRRIAMGNDVMRQFLTISAKELNSRADAELRVRRYELLKARAAATEAAKKALVAVLPFDLPGADSPEEQKERAWDLMAVSLPIGQNDGSNVRGLTQQKTPEDAVVLPIRLEQGKKITLIHEPFRRIALTDSGIEDRQGRHLFYQEEWERRRSLIARMASALLSHLFHFYQEEGEQLQGIIAVKRWAVAVNTTIGQHTLLRRYQIRQFRGDLDGIDRSQGRDYLSRLELPESSAPASMQEITSAMAEAARSREEVHDAVRYFQMQIREALARNDALLTMQNKPALDDELPNELRENLFDIRGRLAGTTAVLDAENKVRRAVERATGGARILEALIAWVNGSALERESPAGDSRALLETLNRSDTEIDLTRSLEREALAALPPDASGPEAQLPALRRSQTGPWSASNRKSNAKNGQHRRSSPIHSTISVGKQRSVDIRKPNLPSKSRFSITAERSCSVKVVYRTRCSAVKALRLQTQLDSAISGKIRFYETGGFCRIIPVVDTPNMLPVAAMAACYALEKRSRWFLLGLTGAAALGAAYELLEAAWPFGAIEAVWSIIALQRWRLGRVSSRSIA